VEECFDSSGAYRAKDVLLQAFSSIFRPLSTSFGRVIKNNGEAA